MIQLVILAILIGGCATRAKLGCDARDWYEIGRRDGAQGLPFDRVDPAVAACKLGERDHLVFSNGRNAGLVEYCHPENGFQLGRVGGIYRDVCPPAVEAEFLAAFKRGEAARALELIDREIERLTRERARAQDPGRRRRMSARLNELRASRAR